MENVNGPTLRESQRIAFELLRPVVHLLRASGITAGAVRSASDRACRRHDPTPSRGIWLDRACFVQLAHVLTVWARDPEFIDEKGSPMRLRLAGGARPGGGRPGAASFPYLLKKAQVSIGADRALEWLRALGSVRRCDRGQRVRLVSSVLLGVMGDRFLALPMLDAVRRFAETVEHNLCERPAPSERRMHQWVGYASLDARQLGEVQRFVRSSGQVFLDAVDEKLLACSRGNGGDRRLFGVGLYVFGGRTAKRARRQPRRRCASA